MGCCESSPQLADAIGTWRGDPCCASRRNGAFTLIEILVAVAILSILGTSLVVVLRGGVKTWRRGEARRESFEVAQAVLGQLRDDLACATVETPATHGDAHVELRLICDADARGRQRLAVTRTIKAEAENPLTGGAGNWVGGTSRIELRGDLKKLGDHTLRATGGLAEVAWALGRDEDEVLYRGFRSPVGGKFSFFKGDDAFWLAPLAGAPTSTINGGKEAAPGEAICRPIAGRVIYLGFLFWTSYTNTWATDTPPVRWRKAGEKSSGPLDYWDSTRGVLKPEGSDHRHYDTFMSTTSLGVPDDDVLPERVKITLVVREGDAAESATYLALPTTADATFLIPGEPDRVPKDLPTEGGFLKIDREWIRYDAVESGRVRVVERGARGTRATEHKADAEILIGRTFEIIVDLPGVREDWGDR